MSECVVVNYSGRRWCEAHECWANVCEAEAHDRRELERLERVRAIQAEEWPVIPS